MYGIRQESSITLFCLGEPKNPHFYVIFGDPKTLKRSQEHTPILLLNIIWSVTIFRLIHVTFHIHVCNTSMAWLVLFSVSSERPLMAAAGSEARGRWSPWGCRGPLSASQQQSAVEGRTDLYAIRWWYAHHCRNIQQGSSGQSRCLRANAGIFCLNANDFVVYNLNATFMYQYGTINIPSHYPSLHLCYGDGIFIVP